MTIRLRSGKKLFANSSIDDNVLQGYADRNPSTTCLDQFQFTRAQGGLGAITDAQFLHHRGDVVLYCAFGQVELIGDFPVREALGHQA